MRIYKDNHTGRFFELLYIQNEQSPRGGATPYVEPTLWFQPLEIDYQGRIAKGFKRIAGEWARPMSERLAKRYLTEFFGRPSDLTVDDAPKKTKISEKLKPTDDVE